MSPMPPMYRRDRAAGELRGLLGRFVRWCGLDSYKNALLTRRAANSMKAIAIMLVVNFFFDLGAWWLLFNAILSGGQGILELGVHSWFALIASLLISAVILIYEQQFMTADLTARRKGLLGAITLRVGVIIAAALVTTQPVELMLFKGPIERRIHEESIRREAVTRLKNWQDARKRQEPEGIPLYFREEKNKAEEKKTLEEGKLSDLKRDLRNAEARLSANRRALAYARERLSKVPEENREAKNFWQSAVASRQESVNRAQAEVDDLNQKLPLQETEVAKSVQKVADTTAAVEQQVKTGVDDEKQVRDWIARVRQSGVKELVSSHQWSFMDQTYDFFNQLRVLQDLRLGRPSRWPDASAKDREELAKTFNFAPPADESQEAQLDATFYSYAYWAVFGIAFVIPALLLAFKLLQPQELRDYYSQDKQEGVYRT